jgi:hypothetical protein
MYYAVCDTAGSTQIKEITVAGITSLVAGLSINVKFSNSNSISNPYLKVNSLDSKPIYQYGTTAASTNSATTGWQSGAVVQLTYDGTGWVRDQGYNTNTTYNVSHVQCTTSGGTADKTASCAYYVLNADNVFVIVMRYGNTKAAALTLNVNSTGAKPIYINGAASSATNYTLPAGTHLCYYDGTNYYFNTDGSSPLPGYVKSVNGQAGAVAITASGLGISDYITERGTSGDWTYVKYASKKFEAWCTKSVPDKASENSINGWYWTREYLTLPSFAATVECALANAYWGTGVAWGNVRNTGSSSIEVLIFGNQSTGLLYVRCEIRGTYT